MTCALGLGDHPPSSFASSRKEALAALLGLLVVGSLSGCDQSGSPVAEEVSTKRVQLPYESIDPRLASKFQGLAPEDWKLRDTTEGAAAHEVLLASEREGETVRVRGNVLLDGRFETKLSPWAFSPSAIAAKRKKFGAVPQQYATVDGFEAIIDSHSLGFDTNRDIHRRSIKYLNRDQGVFCRGFAPGEMRCLWGTPEVRLILNFHSDHTVHALEYIKQNVFQNR